MESNGRSDLLGGLRDAPLQVTVAHPHIVTTIDAGWVRDYRSYWGELPRVQQADIEPAHHPIFRSVVRGPGTVF
jgi:hypothetical protein